MMEICKRIAACLMIVATAFLMVVSGFSAFVSIAAFCRVAEDYASPPVVEMPIDCFSSENEGMGVRLHGIWEPEEGQESIGRMGAYSIVFPMYKFGTTYYTWPPAAGEKVYIVGLQKGSGLYVQHNFFNDYRAWSLCSHLNVNYQLNYFATGFALVSGVVTLTLALLIFFVGLSICRRMIHRRLPMWAPQMLLAIVPVSTLGFLLCFHSEMCFSLPVAVAGFLLMALLALRGWVRWPGQNNIVNNLSK